MSQEPQSRTELRKFLAPEFIQGPGALGLVGRYALNLGGERVLVVSDPGVRSAGWTDAVTKVLDAVGLEWTLFDEVSPNPRTHECARGVDCFRSTGSNLIVAIGGGSPMDCAKGIAVLASNKGAITDYEGVDEVRNPAPPSSAFRPPPVPLRRFPSSPSSPIMRSSGSSPSSAARWFRMLPSSTPRPWKLLTPTSGPAPE